LGGHDDGALRRNDLELVGVGAREPITALQYDPPRRVPRSAQQHAERGSLEGGGRRGAAGHRGLHVASTRMSTTLDTMSPTNAYAATRVAERGNVRAIAKRSTLNQPPWSSSSAASDGSTRIGSG